MKHITLPMLSALALTSTSCCQLFNNCPCEIKPPGTVEGKSVDTSAKLAADALSSSLGKGEVSGNVKATVTKTYGTVQADDVALYLLLQAAECADRKKQHETANSLRQTAREELLIRRNKSGAAVTKVADAPATLTTEESKVLAPSPLKQDIIQLLPATSPADTTPPPPAAGGTSGT